MNEITQRPLAVITGASSGIGATFAHMLAGRGYDLMLIARRADRLAELAEELRRSGVSADTMTADLTADADLDRVSEYLATSNRIELLVNNAGYGVRGRFWKTPVEVQEGMHRLHITATLRLTHAALRAMTTRDHGSIINVASVAGFFQSGATSYSATKCWIISFTEGLDIELKTEHSRVKVQALCPGFTVTEFHKAMGVRYASVPGPLWMKADDVVRASLKALDRDQLIVVPGLIYKLLVRIGPRIPRFVKNPLAMWAGRRRDHDHD